MRQWELERALERCEALEAEKAALAEELRVTRAALKAATETV